DQRQRRQHVVGGGERSIDRDGDGGRVRRVAGAVFDRVLEAVAGRGVAVIRISDGAARVGRGGAVRGRCRNDNGRQVERVTATGRVVGGNIDRRALPADDGGSVV